MDTDDALLLALLVLKKREIAKNAVARRLGEEAIN